jgi:hypothetical protein
MRRAKHDGIAFERGIWCNAKSGALSEASNCFLFRERFDSEASKSLQEHLSKLAQFLESSVPRIRQDDGTILNELNGPPIADGEDVPATAKALAVLTQRLANVEKQQSFLVTVAMAAIGVIIAYEVISFFR